VLSLNLPTDSAVPKNRPPRSAADAPSVVAALALPGHTATVAAVRPATAPATSQARAARIARPSLRAGG
jgi:hypothetical protein